jgi:ribosomal protein S18 acetylase RimI-like enzyme
VNDIRIEHIPALDALPSWTSLEQLAQLFHDNMKPFQDTVPDVRAALDYAFVAGKGQGGFLVLASREEQMLGALLMLDTGMGGYIPKLVLLFVWVSPELRGQGVGRKIIDEALRHCDGEVKLHVEYENPAKRLYERMGFTSKYAEMRLVRK